MFEQKTELINNFKEVNLSGLSASGFTRDDDNSVTTDGIDDSSFPVENGQILSENLQRRKPAFVIRRHLVEEKLVEKFVSLQRRTGTNEVGKRQRRKVQSDSALRFYLNGTKLI